MGAATLPLAVDTWSPGAVAAVVVIGGALVLLLLALWDVNRFLWAGRTVAAMVFVGYVTFLGTEIYRSTRSPEKPGHHSRNTVVRAGLGLIVIGWPALMFALFGRFSLRPNVDDIATPIAPDDPLWVKALQRSRETIPLLRELQVQHKGEIAVKFPFQTDTGATEHLWGRLLDLRERDMWVTVLTPPIAQKGVPPQHLKVPVADMEDWQLDLPDGKVRGGFSTRAQILIYKREGRVLPAGARGRENDFLDA